MSRPTESGTPGAALTRARVLEALRDAEHPLHPQDLATRLGIHVNTVHRHLEVLEGAGLVERGTEERASPGRPRVVYAPTGEDSAGRSGAGHRFLSRALAAFVAATHEDPENAGLEAGEAWGRHLTGAEPFTRVDPEVALERAFDVLEELGFAPSRHDPEDAGGTLTTQLGECPFPELAQTHPELICNLHLGLVRGGLTSLDPDVVIEEFAPSCPGEPCILRFRFRDDRR